MLQLYKFSNQAHEAEIILVRNAHFAFTEHPVTDESLMRKCECCLLIIRTKHAYEVNPSDFKPN